MGLPYRWRPRVGRRFQIFSSILALLLFGTIPQVWSADTGTQTSAQPDKGGNIDLKKSLTVPTSIAKTDPPSAITSQPPTIKTPETKSGATDFFMDGIDALDVQNFQEAAELFKKAVALAPQNLEYQYYLAVAYVRLKKSHEALEIFESLIVKEPKLYFKAYFDVAAIYSSQKNYDKAIETLRTAEKIDPKSGRVFLDLGYAYKDSGNYTEAVKCFSRAKELDPQLGQISVYMTGATYLEEEKFDQAAVMFKKAVELDPKNPLAESARQTIPRVEDAAWARKPWYLITSFNWGYDDNVARDPLEEVAGRPRFRRHWKRGSVPDLFPAGGVQIPEPQRPGGGRRLHPFLSRLPGLDGQQRDLPQSPCVFSGKPGNLFFFGFSMISPTFIPVEKSRNINPPVYITFANNSFARLRMHSFMPTISILEPYDLRTDINLAYTRSRITWMALPGTPPATPLILPNLTKFPIPKFFPELRIPKCLRKIRR